MRIPALHRSLVPENRQGSPIVIGGDKVNISIEIEISGLDKPRSVAGIVGDGGVEGSIAAIDQGRDAVSGLVCSQDVGYAIDIEIVDDHRIGAVGRIEIHPGLEGSVTPVIEDTNRAVGLVGRGEVNVTIGIEISRHHIPGSTIHRIVHRRAQRAVAAVHQDGDITRAPVCRDDVFVSISIQVPHRHGDRKPPYAIFTSACKASVTSAAVEVDGDRPRCLVGAGNLRKAIACQLPHLDHEGANTRCVQGT